MFYLFIFEFLGTTELVVILVVALVLFGPRKLPQLSRSLGKSLGEFKRASEEFKQTWEREVALESVEKEREVERTMLPEGSSILGETVGREKAAPVTTSNTEAAPEMSAPAVHDLTTNDGISMPSTQTASTVAPAPEPTRKRDWL